MIYDDDTSRHHHFEIDSEDRGLEPGRVRRPPLRVRVRILELAAQPGYGPERIEACLRYAGVRGVTVRDVRHVLAQGDPRAS